MAQYGGSIYTDAQTTTFKSSGSPPKMNMPMQTQTYHAQHTGTQTLQPHDYYGDSIDEARQLQNQELWAHHGHHSPEQYRKRQLEIKKKHQHIEFKKPWKALGGLGPDLQREQCLAEAAKMKGRKEYAKKIREKTVSPSKSTIGTSASPAHSDGRHSQGSQHHSTHSNEYQLNDQHDHDHDQQDHDHQAQYDAQDQHNKSYEHDGQYNHNGGHDWFGNEQMEE